MVTIRSATETDASVLPAIERSSGEAFRQVVELAWIADGGVTSIQRHVEIIRKGEAWVGLSETEGVVGFLSAEVRADTLHVWQMSVHVQHQKKGIGRALVKAATQWAQSKRLTALTLMTFREVPWNASFYQSCGFQIIDPDLWPMLRDALKVEAQARLAEDQRCAMALRL